MQHHCWTVTVGGQGYNGNIGQSIMDFVVCQGDANVTIVLGALDSHLNDKGYIVPGLGDAGDRQFGPPK